MSNQVNDKIWDCFVDKCMDYDISYERMMSVDVTLDDALLFVAKGVFPKAWLEV